MSVVIKKQIYKGKAVAIVIFEFFGKPGATLFKQIDNIKREIIGAQLFIKLIYCSSLSKMIFSALAPSKIKRWRVLLSHIESSRFIDFLNIVSFAQLPVSAFRQWKQMSLINKEITVGPHQVITHDGSIMRGKDKLHS